MANYATLKAALDAAIYTNTQRAITGDILNAKMDEMINALGAGYQYVGEATPSTNPGSPDSNVVYLATTAGTYTNFGGLTLASGKIAFLRWNGTWAKDEISVQAELTIDSQPTSGSTNPVQSGGVFTALSGKQQTISTVNVTVDNNTGTPSATASVSGGTMTMAFTNLKGAKGDTGATGATGATGPQGPKGDQGNPGSSVDYAFTLANNLTTTDSTVALAAPQGKVLDEKISQLGIKIDRTDVDFSVDNTLIWYETTSDHQGGATAGAGSYKSTDFIDVSGVDYLLFTLWAPSWGTIAGVAFYDENRNYISGLKGYDDSNQNVAINSSSFPVGTKYVRFCTQKVTSITLYVSIYYDLTLQNVNADLQEAKDDVAAIANELAKIEESPVEFDVPSTLIWYETTSDHQGGATAGSGSFKSTSFVPAENAQTIKFSLYIPSTSTAAAIAFYDADKNYISGLKGYTELTPNQILTAASFPPNTAFIRFCTQNVSDSFLYTYVTITYSIPLPEIRESLWQLEEAVNPKSVFWAACGDSITNANHNGIDDIPNDDPYLPIDGYTGVNTYKRKNYAYYIAKEAKIKWANYGYGGTTLSHTAPKAYQSTNFFPFCDTRMTELKEGIEWDYISIFFGLNDGWFNPIYQRDLWLSETYGGSIGYPVQSSQIGASGFANATQKAACDAVTGEVAGVQYDNNENFFFAKFVGSLTDTTKNTWCGAWNNVLPYLMAKYPKAKIVIVATYDSLNSICHNLLHGATVAIGEKWGVPVFDFENVIYWWGKSSHNTTPFANPDNPSGWVAGDGTTTLPATVEGYNHARLSYDGTHPSNVGYKMLSGPFGKVLLQD